MKVFLLSVGVLCLLSVIVGCHEGFDAAADALRTLGARLDSVEAALLAPTP